MKSLLRDLGPVEWVCLVLLAAYVILHFAAPASGLAVAAAILFYFSAIWVLIRLVRRGVDRLIWRLRNRLIVAYVFIAFVPIVLIAMLAGIGTYVVMGQLAGYLVNSELERRTQSLRNPAHMLVRSSMVNRAEVMKRIAPFVRGRFPALELLIRDSGVFRYPEDSTLTFPPAGWKDASGIIVKDGGLYSWAHVRTETAEAVLLAPITHDFLSELIPGLGDASFVNFSDNPARKGTHVQVTYGKNVVQLDDVKSVRRDRIPPKYVSFDVEITGATPISISFWNSPRKTADGLIVVHTRTSAVLGIIFGKKMDWGQLALVAFLFVAGLFLIFELISLVIGISLSRTITRAVHNLYEGTQRIKEGDFSHRISVRGSDQLAELSASFNTMTENLERLIVVEKEKERLQSELAIAREVQDQLFPKNVPVMRSLELSGACQPARMVSGDYYDFLLLAESKLALAIGDVAGKGISAALLMAAIQSIMRTQLTAGIPVAAVAGDGNGSARWSTSHLVAHLNKQLYANTSSEKYATFCFGLYDEASGVLTYTNAGHLPPILLRGGEATNLEVTGTVVGAFPFAQYEERQVRMESGDLLVAYTDGITEPENAYGEMFGEERLKDLLLRWAENDSSETIARTMEAVKQWTGSSELQDDMTMLIMRRL